MFSLSPKVGEAQDLVRELGGQWGVGMGGQANAKEMEGGGGGGEETREEGEEEGRKKRGDQEESSPRP